MMFGHGLFQTRASMAAQIKTQAVTIGELSELVAKQDTDLEVVRANRQISEGILNARIRELTNDRDLALSARDELAEQVRKLTPHRGKGGRFEAKPAEWEGTPHEYGYTWGPFDGPGETDKFIPSTTTSAGETADG